ncbi:pyrroline-5-carboxylate reductase [Acidianus sulfidivorans JP7]|uniref:Pyrroline-5-carboxylate reductase n=1 Tax=Acidianus sulfidivorans JP7 TaxID=619593 RepID=A0A2U9IM33_9CREN|nr:pyrroline-5-carboxylate reductase [Acidianus sulfidivorans]AWR96974.1 pyrroline-5-carboxylate reductase [Acidianus sulfidivorans JP7]
MRIAVLGAGKIGYAILKNLKNNNIADYLIGTGRSQSTLEKIKQLGIEYTSDNNLAVQNADYIIISVKPQHFIALVNSINPRNWEKKTVISVMAGVKISTIKRLIKSAEVYRAMPNINALIGKSTTAIAEERNENVDKIFKSIGNTYWVQEDLLDAWTALIGSGPAFISELVDAFVLGAVNCGMPRDLAYNAVLDMIKSTSDMLSISHSHPLSLRDNVTTPAGTTIKGLLVMESEGIKAGIIKTIEASYKRSIDIGRDIQNNLLS